VSLQDAVRLSVDETELGTLAWQSCDAGGCYATGPVADAWLQAMRAGEQLAAILTARDGREITFTFALDGFTRAADMLP
jgi:invasion protein IalB